MQTQRQNTYSAVFFMAVVLLAAYVMQRFFLPVIWAAILATATWPVFERLDRYAGRRDLVAALASTLLVATIFIAPVIFAVAQASLQAPALAHVIIEANQHGIAAPAFLPRVPMAGPYLQQWWATTLTQEHALTHLLSGLPARSAGSVGGFLRLFGARVLKDVVAFGFAIVCLFFFYLDGRTLRRQIDAIGQRCIGMQRWPRYASAVPMAIRSTVNGLVLVGLGEGILLGIAYLIAGVPSAILLGALTAALAIIPFGALAAYLGVALYLAVAGNSAGAIGVAVWGTLVLLIADHLVRPRIIGGATRVPFLLVLFGILGGVEAFGLIGLFIGPCIMALFVILWRELATAETPTVDDSAQTPG